MTDEREILEQAKKEVHDSGNQSWNSIALVGIQRGRKDLFDFLQNQSELEENKNLCAFEFFEKIEMTLVL